MAELISERKKERKEAYDRITAPTHVTFNYFRKHEKIEGYFQDRSAPDFIGCDRLLKMDTLYGTIQMGYNPRKAQPFIFANIKTSIYDTAASKYQKELREQSMFKNQKKGNENILLSSRRKEDTAVVLYKAERKPWTRESIEPYLRKADQGALRKTMPFMQMEEEYEGLNEARKKRRSLQEKEREVLSGKQKDGNLKEIRQEEVELHRETESLQSLLIRKDQQSRIFFKKLNYSFDIQKHEMFRYYRNMQEKIKLGMEVPPEEPPKNPDKKKDEEETDI